ncbi:MAG: COX15/CtaA family protein [Polyangiaceae bacterium]|nr:COX15/CtaA family protein [Polyangiaceae bacterium]
MGTPESERTPSEQQGSPTKEKRLYRLWQWGLAYSILVILFGAVVRITGSGAGCGQHWPTCKGEILHLPQALETVIELFHRLTSGGALLGSVVLCLLGYRWSTARSVRRSGLAVALFMVGESLVGAALVLLKYVGDNDSVGRAIIMAAHLLNTSLLLFAFLSVILSLKARLQPAWMDGMQQKVDSRESRRWLAFLGTALFGVVAASGAITALGDTLYPLQEGAGGWHAAADTMSLGAHFLVRLRVIHPILAISSAGILFWGAGRLGTSALIQKGLRVTVALQVVAGFMNIALNAPGWMQVLHLALANAIWILWSWLWIEESWLPKRTNHTSSWREAVA